MEAGFRPRTRRTLVTLAAVLLATTGSLAAAGAAPARPQLLAPGKGKVLRLGSEPTFKVRDRSANARRYGVFLIVSPTKRTNRHGELKRHRRIGTFAKMRRTGRFGFVYRTPAYAFDHWFMQRPGTYYWQAFHVDCRVRGCRVLSRIRTFKVRA